MRKEMSVIEILTELNGRFSESLKKFDGVLSDLDNTDEEEKINALAKISSAGVKLAIGINYLLSTFLPHEKIAEAYEWGRNELIEELEGSEEDGKNEGVGEGK